MDEDGVEFRQYLISKRFLLIFRMAVRSILDFFRGRSHRHTTWHSAEYLKGVKGLRKLENYQKKVAEIEAFKNNPETSRKLAP